MHKDAPIPDHPLSRPAAIAALAAGEQNRFWEYHDRIFQNISTLSPESFFQIAQELDLDMDSFQKSLLDVKHEKHLEKDAKDVINADVQGRPTFFVNGRIFYAHTLNEFKTRIDEELKKKKEN